MVCTVIALYKYMLIKTLLLPLTKVSVINETTFIRNSCYDKSEIFMYIQRFKNCAEVDVIP